MFFLFCENFIFKWGNIEMICVLMKIFGYFFYRLINRYII